MRQAQQEIISFIEAAGPIRTMCVGEFPSGHSVTRLATVGGYLKGYKVESFGSIERVRLTESNGAPLVDASARALRLLARTASLYVPVAINDKAVGALPDMSSVFGYTMMVDGASEGGRIVAEYWPLPDAVSVRGVPQRVTPPYAGMTAFVSEIRHCLPDFRDEFVMPRAGNSIIYLAVLFAKPLLTGLLRHDLRELCDVRAEQDYIVLLDRTLDTAVHTLASARLALEKVNPVPESLDWLVRDVAGPTR